MTTAMFLVRPFTDDDGTLLATKIAQACGCTATDCTESAQYAGFNMQVDGTDDQISAFASDLDLDPETVDGQPYVAPPTCNRCGRLL
jgi:hypothetical protein